MTTCKACNDELTLTVDTEESGGEEQQQTVPDDLHLPCNCHFHWQCLMDQSPQIAVSLSCPSCNTYLPSNPAGPSATNAFLQTSQAQSQILTRYTNEGGVQEGLDILPLITEEAFFAANPAGRPARAMHTMAAEGDVSGILDVLADADADEDIDITATGLLPWQDPLNGGKSALHVAIEARQEEVFWLLLWLGSAVPKEVFPEAVIQSAEGMGLPRREVPAAEDVRYVKDDQGRSPADVSLAVGAPFSNYAQKGLLN